jgi:predicted nucleic acid-binding protein
VLNDGPARRTLAVEQLRAPHLIDSEVAHGPRRSVSGQRLTADAAWIALDAWRRLGMMRYAVFTLLDPVWELRNKVSACDASYIALAELLGCSLLTADARLGRAPGIRCPITVVPR